MNTQFNSLMSLGTSNCWTRCPWGRITILLAVPSGQGPCWLRVPPSWPWLTRQALLREPAGRHVSPGQRALAAAGCWRLQAGPHCDAGPTCARLPQPRDTPHLASPWPHRLTSSALARAATTA